MLKNANYYVRDALVFAEAALDEALDNTGRDAESMFWQPLIKVRAALYASAGAIVLESDTGTDDDAFLVRAHSPVSGPELPRWFVVLGACDARDACETVRDELPTYVKHTVRAWDLLAQHKTRSLPGRFLLSYLVPVHP